MRPSRSFARVLVLGTTRREFILVSGLELHFRFVVAAEIGQAAAPLVEELRRARRHAAQNVQGTTETVIALGVDTSVCGG